MASPKVSVIIPIYNVEQYIERCVRSLFEQTLDDIEFVFINDSTPDNSITILDKLVEEYQSHIAKKRHTVKIVEMPSNSGQATVRRHGVQLATGDYVIHCDSDDWVETNMYETMYNVAKEGDYDIVISNYFYSTDKSDSSIKQNIPECKYRVIAGLLNGSIHSSVCNKLVRRSLYSNVQFWTTENMREDLVMTTQLMYFTNSYSHVDKPLYHYFINNSSICRNTDLDKIIKRYQQSVHNFSIISEFLESHSIKKRYQKSLYTLAFYIKNELCSISNSKEGRKLFNDAFPDITLLKVIALKVKFKSKAKYIATKMHLYPLVRLMRKS